MCDAAVVLFPMTTEQPGKALRLWPGVVIVAAQWFSRFVLPVFFPATSLYGVLAGIAGGPLVLIWWLFLSRAPWVDRLGAVALIVIGLVATLRIAHESVATGMMGMMLPIFAMPALGLALVVSAAAGRRRSTGLRLSVMATAILAACGVFAFLRTGGISGDADSDFHWRWTPTPEERLLATGNDDPPPIPSTAPAPTPQAAPVPSVSSEPVIRLAPPPSVPPPERLEAVRGGPAVHADPVTALSTSEWSGFRGPHRDGVVHGTRIATDWSQSPPVEIWRRPIGPGWSSFAVHANRIYTQEQRGDAEVVSCYDLTTGEPVWRHRTAARFWESNAGAGPRATPTLHNGRVYTLGATGILNALDAGDGSLVWSRNIASDTNTPVPGWGFASSPLVVGDLVIGAAAGTLAAYDLDTGNPRWFGPVGGWGYSSPQDATIDGVAQVVLLNGGGAMSVVPADGTVLWEHHWSGGSIVQPALTSDGSVLVASVDSSASGIGTRRIAVAHGAAGWTAVERWTSTALKPSFNDLVIHNGHAFGFDGSILACLDLEDGKRMWKGGRYGHGQLVLLPDQDLLLVLSEEGELALVRATPDQFTEVARVPAIEGKTWNHPVLVGDVLLVRNGEVMVAFRLSLAAQ